MILQPIITLCSKIIYIENYFEALKILNKNILYLDVEEKSKIIKEDCFKFFNYDKVYDEKFKIIFMDPPYKEKKNKLFNWKDKRKKNFG